MKVFDYIAHETERQSGTIQEALGMHAAWKYLCVMDDLWIPLGETRIKYLASLVKNDTVSDYRSVPAVFNQGEPAVSAHLVPQAMHRLADELVMHYHDPVLRSTADFLTKEFLLIHPFTDGNGRVASLMRNFLLRTLDDPEPMPYYFGEK